MTTQRYALEAWLGDDHGLTGEQLTNLMRISDEINEHYSATYQYDPDEPDIDNDLRDAALLTAYHTMTESPEKVLELLHRDLLNARAAEAAALAGMRQAARIYVTSGIETQAGFARRAGVDRMAVREWLGLRNR